MYQSTEAHVTVDFSNLPRGARVEADPQTTTPIDLGMGYSMGSQMPQMIQQPAQQTKP